MFVGDGARTLSEPDMAERLRQQAAMFRLQAVEMPPSIAASLIRAAEQQERRARELERQQRGGT
jgi:hypothetical protein